MGTTKLTRKEILAEDPVHEALVRIIELLREQGKSIGLILAAVALVAVGIYFGLRYMETRESGAQRDFTRAMDFYYARVDSNAMDDPYGRGSDPLFRTDELRLQATVKSFTDFTTAHGSSKLAVAARHYLALCQLQLGKNEEAVRNLEAVRNNTQDRTVGYLAKKVLAIHYLDTGNLKGAQEIFEGMIKDPQCQLPREDLKLDLARTLDRQGKRDEALKILREAREQGGRSLLNSRIGQEIDRLEGRAGVSAANAIPLNLQAKP